VILGADTMSGVGAESVDTLMCMRGPHRAWDTWGEGRRVGASGQEWQCAQRGPGVLQYRKGSRSSARSSARSDFTRLPDYSPTPYGSSLARRVCVPMHATYPTLHSRRHLWRQSIRHGFPFWKLGATRGYQGEQFS
jgi:hypothetical protein